MLIFHIKKYGDYKFITIQIDLIILGNFSYYLTVKLKDKSDSLLIALIILYHFYQILF